MIGPVSVLRVGAIALLAACATAAPPRPAAPRPVPRVLVDKELEVRVREELDEAFAGVRGFSYELACKAQVCEVLFADTWPAELWNETIWEQRPLVNALVSMGHGSVEKKDPQTGATRWWRYRRLTFTIWDAHDGMAYLQAFVKRLAASPAAKACRDLHTAGRLVLRATLDRNSLRPKGDVFSDPAGSPGVPCFVKAFAEAAKGERVPQPTSGATVFKTIHPRGAAAPSQP